MMKRLLCLLLMVLCLVLCACGEMTPEPEPKTTNTSKTVETTTEMAEDTTVPTQTTLPPHSEFYIPELSVEDVILYFNEVCLDAEYHDTGDPGLLQKWDGPILYWVHGEPTQEDLAVLESFVTWLNEVEGFPGIRQAESLMDVNLDIHFCPQAQIPQIMGGDFYNLDGAVTFWYEENIIYDAIICIRTDMDQETRNSVILEELYNGLGPVQDTALRPDSIIYQDFSTPQWLTEMDELLLRLLYHPSIRPGMTAAECEQVIRQLYS